MIFNHMLNFKALNIEFQTSYRNLASLQMGFTIPPEQCPSGEIEGKSFAGGIDRGWGEVGIPAARAASIYKCFILEAFCWFGARSLTVTYFC